MRVQIFNDYQPQGVLEKSTVTSIVDNRWQRERLRSMTAIAICRHSFGRTLEEAGAKSWSEVLAIVHAAKKEHYETVEKITAFTDQIAATAVHLKQTSDACDTDELSKEVRKIADGCIRIYEVLACLRAALDEERDFFDVYMGKSLEQQIRLECSRDAQLDKLLARLTVLQEARRIREKLQKSQETPSASPVAHKTDEASAAMTKRPDNANELDRHDDEPDAAGEPDPLDEFLRDG